jgi:hypothetical protein
MYIGKWNVVNIILEVAKPTFKCHPRPHEAQAEKMMTKKVKRYLTSFGHCLNVIQWSLQNSIHMLQLNIYVYRTLDNAYDIPFKCLTCVHIDFGTTICITLYKWLLQLCFERPMKTFYEFFFYSILSCFEDLELALVRLAYCVDLAFLHDTGLLIRVPSYRGHRGWWSSSIIFIRKLSFACYASHFTSMCSLVLLNNLSTP